MALKAHKPVTPGQRGYIQVDTSELYKGKPHKALVRGRISSGGRNNAGRITARRIGGGHKRKYRLVDFKRNKFDVQAVVQRIEYDPNRSAFIALLLYEDGDYAYILAPQGLKPEDKIISSKEAVDIRSGNAMPLDKMPIGTLVHNVEMKPGKGGQMARSAGCSLQFVGKDRGYAQLKMPSNEVRLVLIGCMATVGAVSNPDQKNIKLGKAGRKRWLGKRPEVRGVAMNPIDHPHGGGEGKTSGGRHPVTPWGKPTKGKKTRSNKATGKYIIRRRMKRRRG